MDTKVTVEIMITGNDNTSPHFKEIGEFHCVEEAEKAIKFAQQFHLLSTPNRRVTETPFRIIIAYTPEK